MKDRLEERERVLRRFLDREQEKLALACHAIARAFARGATLLAYGEGAAATDAAHVAVEFMHPVIVGKRAFPALAPPNDVAAMVRNGDVSVGIGAGARSFLERARQREALTISFDAGPADFELVVPTSDPFVAQEVHETAYHVLWELVHVFFEHPGLLEDACITCGDVAVEAKVVAVEDASAVVERNGAREEVAADLVDVVVGDTVLCHAGVVLEKL
jgi:D-sedoheptulose 7-phosphate isomerase